jgi:hypothetical protein
MTTFNIESVNKQINQVIELIDTLDLIQIEKVGEETAKDRVYERLCNDLVMLRVQQSLLVKANQSGAV